MRAVDADAFTGQFFSIQNSGRSKYVGHTARIRKRDVHHFSKHITPRALESNTAARKVNRKYLVLAVSRRANTRLDLDVQARVFSVVSRPWSCSVDGGLRKVRIGRGSPHGRVPAARAGARQELVCFQDFHLKFVEVRNLPSLAVTAFQHDPSCGVLRLFKRNKLDIPQVHLGVEKCNAVDERSEERRVGKECRL